MASPRNDAEKSGDDGYEPVTVDSSASDAELLHDADLVDGAMPPPQRSEALVLPDVGEITGLDREFIQRVFVQVKDVDFRSPPPPPPKRDLAGPDRKVAMLRQKVHELERDLARVGFIWTTLQGRYLEVESLVAAKEAERDEAVSRHKQIRDLSAQQANRDRSEIEANKRRIAELEAQRTALEAELHKTRESGERTATDLSGRLATSEQEKQTLLADFRNKMEAAQQAFAQLREQSTRALADLEARLKARDDEFTQQTRVLESTTRDLNAKTTAYDDLAAQNAGQMATIAGQVQEIERLVASLAERDKTVTSFAAEMTKSREQHQDLVSELKSGMAARDALVESMRNEVKSARAEFTQLADQYEARRVELEALGKTHDEVKAAATQTNERLAALEQSLAGKTQELRDAQEAFASERASLQSQITAAQEETRLARADAEALGKKLEGA